MIRFYLKGDILNKLYKYVVKQQISKFVNTFFNMFYNPARLKNPPMMYNIVDLEYIEFRHNNSIELLEILENGDRINMVYDNNTILDYTTFKKFLNSKNIKTYINFK